MAQLGCCWWHLILSTYGSWLPGDARGFRNKEHRVHSSGDYRHRPPVGEHRQLHEHAQKSTSAAVIFSPTQRRDAGQAICQSIKRANVQCLALAAGPTHVHLLVEYDWHWEAIEKLAGRLKQTSSFQLRETIPGRLWAGRGRPIRIRDRDHHRNVFHYILNHGQKEGAWVWRFDRGEISST